MFENVLILKLFLSNFVIKSYINQTICCLRKHIKSFNISQRYYFNQLSYYGNSKDKIKINFFLLLYYLNGVNK